MTTQIERQTSTPAYSGKRELDFSPFAAELDALTPDRIAALDQMLIPATIPQIQDSLLAGTFSSYELTCYFLERIRRYNPRYNAVIELNPDALTIARQRDTERAAGGTFAALHGIPVLLKDNVGTGDRMRTTAGTKALENCFCDRDAAIVRQLRAAGAVLLGKTNLSEWANFMTWNSSNGFSALGGQTRNAYGRFDVGGSSSGSGSAIAARFAVCAIGTETSGSLVSPASQNSLATCKPSLGLVSRDRIIPITDQQDTAGPMTRTVTDLAFLLQAISAPDTADPVTLQRPAGFSTDFPAALQRDALRGKRIGWITREQESVAGDHAALEQAALVLRQQGAQIVPLPPLHPEWSILTFFYGMHIGVNVYLQALGANAPFQTLPEIVAWNAQDLANRAPFAQDILEMVAKTPLNAETAAAYQRIAEENRASAAQLVDDTLRAHQLDCIADINTDSTYLYAPSGYPAVSVPMGYRPDGEPLNLTFFAGWMQDASLIALAYAYEQAARVRREPDLMV